MFLSRNLQKEKGITLIALVVTILILLILAGISVSTLTGSNGILTKASETKTKVEIAQEKEELQMAVMASQMEETNTLEIKKENLENAIKQQFGNNKDFSVTDNGDGSFLVNMNDTQRMYYVSELGEVIAEENILKISTADELKAFRDDVNSGNTYEGWYVYLANDITLDINEEWEPIGYYVQNSENTSIKDGIYNENNNPFSGIFDGQDYKVDYMNINNSKTAQGLFGIVTNGHIKNINLGENCRINMEGTGCGGIVGIVLNSGTIYNCNNYADMEQTKGGIVGSVIESVTISNCINYGDLSEAIGGILGSSNGTDWEEFENEFHTIINCANYGNITKNVDSNFLGGIAGYFKGTITNSFNAGNILMNNNQNNVGGIVGDIFGNVLNCYNVGNITTQAYSAGGIIGYIDAGNTGSLMNCYNKGNVESLLGNINSIGELIGANVQEMKIINSYISSDTFTALDLGSAYTEDTENINNGYPILAWQHDQTKDN